MSFASWDCLTSLIRLSRGIWRDFLSTSPAAERGIDAILFNGGFFIPQVFRQRIQDVVEHWFGRRPAVFENQDLDLAVAIGAAYYSYVRSTGSGVLVRGGLPRAYFLGLHGLAGVWQLAIQAVCVMPRGTEEGDEIKLEQPELQLCRKHSGSVPAV